MPPRFFVPGPYASGDQIDLPADEAQHLTRVLRLRSGDAVRVFNGRGQEFDAIVAIISKNAASVRVGNGHPSVPEPGVAITVAHAVLKGDKMDDVVRDAVMIGAAAIQPVVTARTEVTLAAIERGNRQQRWERVAISSAKQCGRAAVPSILRPMSFGELVEALGHLALPQPALMLVEPSASSEGRRLADLDTAAPKEATLVVGPEGGWTAEEVDQGSAVCRLLRLGDRTLRADAMATIAIAALFTLYREF